MVGAFSVLQRKPVLETGEAPEVMVGGVHLGSVGNRNLRNLRIGDEIAAARSGDGEEIQYVGDVLRAGVQRARDLAVGP